jgi:hypothetical protein
MKRKINRSTKDDALKVCVWVFIPGAMHATAKTAVIQISNKYLYTAKAR